ncbi:sensor domain-containing diguanylate cyclase [Niallia taxi]|uniref:Diguanylate cyclase n=1 Tax=Niallia taxi TaxID=2499688 RepID=A0A437K8Y1_9BACI|nr:sensor domain-containing diguanylate cyclase [Niallia taxi]MDK8641937.1 sensor domain-containing diguanylate cyclase [Niallia taxi]MED4036394.1 sensor domain-containing diguanylate cyclase [Niallia taxi]RVT60775.1 diguanylate cyclase [Niallia taxi]
MEEHMNDKDQTRTNEERFRLLVEHVSDWIWEVDENGIYTYASPQIKDILGYSPEEVIGKTPFHLMEPLEGKRIAPIFEYHVANKLPIKSLENINLHRDGHEVILETSGSPIINADGKCIGYRGIDRDITLRKQQERRQQQLLDIIEASPDFIATLDTAGNSLYYNPAARKMLGVNQEESTGDQVTQRWITDKIKTVGIPTAIEKGHWKGETTILKEDGAKIPVSQMIVAHKSENGDVEFLSTIAHDITERKELEKVVYYQAHYDPLTNLPNRRFLINKLSKLIENQTKHKVAVLFMDLDNFKEINDNLGHEIGDKLLKMTADRLKSGVNEADFVCRYGGDEFILMLENIQSNVEVEERAERIIETFQEPFQFDGISWKISGSIGISIFPDDGADLAALIQKADNAMYQIKRTGKNNFSRE